MQADPHAPVIHLYGVFMIAWSVADGVIQAAIMKQSKLDPVRTIIFTAGMQFRQRVSVLSSLLMLAGDKHADAIALLQKLEKKAKRNMLVHGSIVVGVPGQLTFVKASAAEDTGVTARKATFTAPQLQRHAVALNDEVVRLQALLGVTDADVQRLADAAIAEAR